MTAILVPLLALLSVQEPAPPAAPASPSPVELTWNAPAGCPDAQSVRDGIARGLATVAGRVARVQASVTVTAMDAEHWRAALELRGPDWTATRMLKGPSCAAVADASALVIVLALAAELQEREVIVEAATPRPVEAPRSSPTIGLGAVVDTRALPSPAPGVALGAGWRWAQARVDLRVALFGAQPGRIEGQPDKGASFWLLTGSLRGCYLVGGVAAVGPCAMAGLDRLAGHGFGPISSSDGSYVAPFLGGGLALELRMSRWVVPFFSAEAAFPLVRARFSIDHVGEVHQAAAVSFRGAAGVELRFR
jgi:hypothetical protein